jgi:ELWxxDGT repeat protein
MFMTSLGDRLLFAFYGAQDLWVTDGTPAGTRKLHDAEPNPAFWTLFQGRLYYVAGATLWVTDGTEAGTGPLLDQAGQTIEGAKQFAVLGDRLVFTTRNRFGFHLWESDGTPAGTFPFRVLDSEVELLGTGERVFFPGHDPATGHELWGVR